MEGGVGIGIGGFYGLWVGTGWMDGLRTDGGADRQTDRTWVFGSQDRVGSGFYAMLCYAMLWYGEWGVILVLVVVVVVVLVVVVGGGW